MSNKCHGMTTGLLRFDDEFFFTLKAVGKLTHEDYQIINPMLDAALAGVSEPKIKALIDGRELQGWELRAAWDDFKLGLKRGREFEKVAIVGNKHWQELAAKVGSWFISGDIEYFDDYDAAVAWLKDQAGG